MSHLTDPREMRKALNAVAYKGRSLTPDGPDWAYQYGAAQLRNCMEHGRNQGLSGEDTMTIIAYHLMLELNRLGEMVLRDKLIKPSAGLVPKVD
jgi:hypothetical protein